jgi:hypothetical protein
MAMLYTTSDLALAHKKTKFESSIYTIKNLSDNENINLIKMPSFLWQDNLPNRASKIKRSLACHDIQLPRASGQVLSYTSEFVLCQEKTSHLQTEWYRYEILIF